MKCYANTNSAQYTQHAVKLLNTWKQNSNITITPEYLLGEFRNNPVFAGILSSYFVLTGQVKGVQVYTGPTSLNFIIVLIVLVATIQQTSSATRSNWNPVHPEFALKIQKEFNFPQKTLPPTTERLQIGHAESPQFSFIGMETRSNMPQVPQGNAFVQKLRSNGYTVQETRLNYSKLNKKNEILPLQSELSGENMENLCKYVSRGKFDMKKTDESPIYLLKKKNTFPGQQNTYWIFDGHHRAFLSEACDLPSQNYTPNFKTFVIELKEGQSGQEFLKTARTKYPELYKISRGMGKATA